MAYCYSLSGQLTRLFTGWTTSSRSPIEIRMFVFAITSVPDLSQGIKRTEREATTNNNACPSMGLLRHRAFVNVYISVV